MKEKTLNKTERFEALEEFTRRHFFLNLASGFLAAVSGVAVLYTVFRFLSPARKGNAANLIEIAEAEIKPGEAHFFKYKNKPAIIVQQEGQYHILSAVCTHLGCIVKWKEEQKVFECPCHAGQYSLDGKVVSGPPPEPLLVIEHVVENGKILIGKNNA